MSDWEKGDRVVVTEGDFKGRQATIVDKDLIGSGVTVALVDDGREIETEEAHIARAEGGRVDVEDGQRVIVTQGRFKGERGTVLETKAFGDGIKVRLDDGEVIDTEEAHVAPVAP
jgi:ribosomal protein L24